MQQWDREDHLMCELVRRFCDPTPSSGLPRCEDPAILLIPTHICPPGPTFPTYLPLKLCVREWSKCPRPRELRAFFSCMAWRAIPGPLSNRRRRLDSLEAAQGAPRAPRRDSRGERPQAERPRFPGPLLRRTRGPDPSSKATLWAIAPDPAES